MTVNLKYTAGARALYWFTELWALSPTLPHYCTDSIVTLSAELPNSAQSGLTTHNKIIMPTMCSDKRKQKCDDQQ